MSKASNSIVWHLVKVAGLWFLLGETAVVAANTYHVPSKPIAYLAGGIFFLHSFLVICETSPTKGEKRNLYSGLLTFLIVATVNLFSLRVTHADDFDAVKERLTHMSEDVSDWVKGTDQAFRNMGAVDHLSSASKLIFEEGSRLSLRQARLHLRRIPPNSKEYSSAQGLLAITEGRMLELELDLPKGSRRGKRPVIEVTHRDQTKERLRVTLRNNGSKPVENIRYKVSYFDMSSGLQIEPDTVSVIKKQVQPDALLTLEVYSDVLKAPVYAAFVVQEWRDAAPRREAGEESSENPEGESTSESAEESEKS